MRMSTNIAIGGIFFITAFLLVWVFRSISETNKKKHQKVTELLYSEITRHREQITIRNLGLNTYDLQKHNLSEALQVQEVNCLYET